MNTPGKYRPKNPIPLARTKASGSGHLDVDSLAGAFDAIAKKHTQGTDQGLDSGGAHAVTVEAIHDAVDLAHSNSLDHSNASDHDAVTLDVNADTLLSLSTQTLGLDTQAANKVFVGPTTGVDAVPTFRALAAADIPDISTAYVPKSLYDAHTILQATSNDTPVAITIGEQQIVGRITSGNIKGLTEAEVTDFVENQGLVLATGKNIELHKALTSNLSWSGLTATLTAGEALAIGDLCYRKSDAKMYKAIASDVAKMPVLAMATGTINQDAMGVFLLQGYIRNDSWTWTEHGVRIYLSDSTAGAMTETAPTGTNKYVQEVAIIIDSVIGGGSTDELYFSPSFISLQDSPSNGDMGSAPTSNWAFDHNANANAHHNAVTVSAPISISTQALSLINDATNAITEIDTGALAASNTVIPTSLAAKTYIDEKAMLWAIIFGG